VDWIYFSTTIEAVQQLKANGYKVYGIEQTEESISLEKFNVAANEKVAVVFGNEIEGVDSNVLEACDGSIEIPQLGMKHSLNISVAAGIVLWKLSEERFKNNASGKSLGQ
jgi:tRNA G18 (ribose-2'-O)-methylase SpoU